MFLCIWPLHQLKNNLWYVWLDLSNIPNEIDHNVEKPGSHSTDAAQFWYLFDVATKELCKQSHMLLWNSSERSLHTVSHLYYSDWNACVWILHCRLDFWAALQKCQQSCVSIVCFHDLKLISLSSFHQVFHTIDTYHLLLYFLFNNFYFSFQLFYIFLSLYYYLYKSVHWQCF